MEYNKSLSARIRRRNNQGFKGEGTNPTFYFGGGDYTDEIQNHKLKDRLDNIAIKNKVGYKTPDGLKIDAQGKVYRTYNRKNRSMSKKYADNHQKR